MFEAVLTMIFPIPPFTPYFLAITILTRKCFYRTDLGNHISYQGKSLISLLCGPLAH